MLAFSFDSGLSFEILSIYFFHEAIGKPFPALSHSHATRRQLSGLRPLLTVVLLASCVTPAT